MCGNYQVVLFFFLLLYILQLNINSRPQVGNYIQTLWNEIKPEEEGAEVSGHLKFSFVPLLSLSLW